MKRSEINNYIREGMRFFEKQHFYLPQFAFWSPEDWKNKGCEVDDVRNLGLGWDVTDFAKGDYDDFGLLLVTLRNGYLGDAEGKTYCEKIMSVKENQKTPFHFHKQKCEDIINRGGGNLVVQIYNDTGDEELADTPISVAMDGVRYELSAGEKVILKPGESITLPQHLYHQFSGEVGKGTVMVGEVSQVNDDKADNFFYGGVPRFPVIEEDEAPLVYLCNEYPASDK